jgi:hypothetical protein
MDLRVRAAETLMPSLADRRAVADHDSTDKRIRLDSAAPAFRQFQRSLHPGDVVLHGTAATSFRSWDRFSTCPNLSRLKTGST